MAGAPAGLLESATSTLTALFQTSPGVSLPPSRPITRPRDPPARSPAGASGLGRELPSPARENCLSRCLLPPIARDRAPAGLSPVPDLHARNVSPPRQASLIPEAQLKRTAIFNSRAHSTAKRRAHLVIRRCRGEKSVQLPRPYDARTAFRSRSIPSCEQLDCEEFGRLAVSSHRSAFKNRGEETGR